MLCIKHVCVTLGCSQRITGWQQLGICVAQLLSRRLSLRRTQPSCQQTALLMWRLVATRRLLQPRLTRPRRNQHSLPKRRLTCVQISQRHSKPLTRSPA